MDQDFRFHYGYIDHSLQFVIGPQVEDRNYTAQEFSEGVVWVFRGYKDGHGFYDLVDTKGHQLFTVYSAYPPPRFHNGISEVNRSCYINKFGQVSRLTPHVSIEYPLGQTPPEQPVLPELAAQWNPNYTEPGLPEWYHSRMELSYGIADYSSGSPKFIRQELERGGCGYAPRRKYRSFSEGLLNVVATMAEDQQRHECYIDKESQIGLVLPQSIVTAGNFNEGLAPIAVAANEIKHTRPPTSEIQRFLLGFIDKSGKIVIQPKFLLPVVQPSIQVNFDQGVAVLRLEDCDEVIDKSGNTLKKFPPGSLGDFHDGLARVRILGDKQGNLLDYKDKSHGIQNKFEYESAVTKLVQDQLKDLVTELPIEFSLTPARINPADRTDKQIKWDIGKHRQRDMVTQQLGGFWRPGAPAQTVSPYVSMIQEKLQAVKLPKRTFNLYGVQMYFILQNGQVHLLDPYITDRGQLD